MKFYIPSNMTFFVQNVSAVLHDNSGFFIPHEHSVKLFVENKQCKACSSDSVLLSR